MAEQGERAASGTNPKWSHDATTLKDLGLTKSESSRYQQLAKANGEFESYLADQKSARLTMNRLLRVCREQRPPDDAAPEPGPVENVDIRHGDLRTTLDDLEGQVDAIITDRKGLGVGLNVPRRG